MAEATLAQARDLLTPGGARGRRTAAGGPERDATMVLRDLSVALPSLTPQDRTAARRILARPTDPAADPALQGYQEPARHACDAHLCVHWVDTSVDAVPPTDSDADGTPDWVATNLVVLDQVWTRIVAQGGYRAPLDDSLSANPGPDGRLDVYLADLGSSGVYGYCTSDDPRERYDLSAYCVLDNDFTSSQFGGQTPLSSLQVTAAHELFHAVQFGYDWLEDLWLMEGTATWMEDEVFDAADDNFQYFPVSALEQPEAPLDYGDRGHQYGAWVFWRFFSEYFGTATTPAPEAVRTVWEYADASSVGPDLYSLQAVAAVSKSVGVPFSRVFADFGAVNRVARSWYLEGVSYPQAPTRKTHTLSLRSRTTGRWGARLHHLANTNVAFAPGSSLRGTWRLKVTLDLPSTSRGSAATFTVHRRAGGFRWYTAKLNRYGDATLYLPFTRSKVAKVALTLTNASTRMRCGTGGPFACAGDSVDDSLPFVYVAKAVR